MKQISEVDINNFRGIKRTTEPIPLSDLTVVIGRNGTGKSSFLEALYSFVGGNDPITGKSRVRRVKEGHSGTLAHKYSGEAKIAATVGDARVESTISNRVRSVFSDGEDFGELLPRSEIKRIEDDGSVDGEEINDVWNLYFSPERSRRGLISDLAGHESEIVNRGIHVDVAEFLNNCSDTNFTEVYLEHEQIRVDPPHSPQYLLELDDLAHGFRKLVPAYIAAEYFTPNYILWDDIESAFHPKLLTEVFEWLSKMDSQAIVATHSIDALLAAVDIDTEMTVVQLGADGDRNMSFEIFTKDELYNILAEGGQDPRFFPVEKE